MIIIVEGLDGAGKSTIIQDLCALLVEPNLLDPIVPQVAEQYKADRKAFFDEAQKWTVSYAKKV